jgi:hypothetical protein
VAALHSEAVQLLYDPFSDPERARQEQFGELIAGGIYWLLHHENKGPEHANEAFWEEHKERRLKLVSDLTNLCQHFLSYQNLVPALLAIHHRLEEISPPLLALYVTSWLKDLQSWAVKLRELPSCADLETALEELGMEPLCIQMTGRERSNTVPQMVDLESVPNYFIVNKSHFVVDIEEVSRGRKSGRSFR